MEWGSGGGRIALGEAVLWKWLAMVGHDQPGMAMDGLASRVCRIALKRYYHPIQRQKAQISNLRAAQAEPI